MLEKCWKKHFFRLSKGKKRHVAFCMSHESQFLPSNATIGRIKKHAIFNYFEQLSDLITMALFCVYSLYLFRSLDVSYCLNFHKQLVQADKITYFFSVYIKRITFYPFTLMSVSSLYCRNAFPLCVCITCQQPFFPDYYFLLWFLSQSLFASFFPALYVVLHCTHIINNSILLTVFRCDGKKSSANEDVKRWVW